MEKNCRYCGSKHLEFEDEKGTVCRECGVIFEETFFEGGTGLHDTPHVPTNIASVSKENLNWRTKSWMSSLSEGGIRGITLRKRIKEQTDRLKISDVNLISEVMDLMNQIDIFHHGKRIPGLPKLTKPIIAACIYIVGRRNGISIHYRNVAEASHSKYFKVVKCIQIITNYLEISVNNLNQEDILDNVLTQFEVMDPKIKELAHDLQKFCIDTLVSTSKSKIIVSICIARLSIESIQGKPIAVTHQKMRYVCKQHVCLPSNTVRVFCLLKDSLIEYGKAIPWLPPLKKTTVVRYIKEIVSFYKEYKDLQKTNVKLKSENKRDNVTLAKKNSIKEARNRVTACLKMCKSPLTDNEIVHKHCKGGQLNEDTTDMKSGAMEGDLSHTCCPHCCGNLKCPIYEQNGQSSYCALKHDEFAIEYLMRKGYSDSQILSGDPSSMFCYEFYKGGSDMNREEVDGRDIDESELHLYIKDKAEIEQTKIHNIYVHDKD